MDGLPFQIFPGPVVVVLLAVVLLAVVLVVVQFYLLWCCAMGCLLWCYLLWCLLWWWLLWCVHPVLHQGSIYKRLHIPMLVCQAMLAGWGW